MRSVKLFTSILLAAAITLSCGMFGGETKQAHEVKVALASPELGSGVSDAEFASEKAMTVKTSSGVFSCRKAELSAGNGVILLSLYGADGKEIFGGASDTVHISGEKCAFGGIKYDGIFDVSMLSGKLKIINTLPLEDYVKDVMPYEIGGNQPYEITVAASIMIRTVPLRGKHEKHGFDVCATSCCQNYKGYKYTDERLYEIARSTSGLILTYDGEPIACAYCNSNGGISCSASDAWGSGEVPYLTSVVLDEGEYAERWRKEMTVAELSSRAAKYGAEGEIVDIKLTVADSGYVTRAELTDESGNTVTVEDTSKVRRLFGLRSAKFTVSYYIKADVLTASGDRQVSGSVMTASGIKPISSADMPSILGETDGAHIITVFDGVGSGHGVGFSLAGAKVLLDKGYKAHEIATFFYKGAVISKI